MILFFYPSRCRVCRRWTWRALGTRVYVAHLYRGNDTLCPTSGAASLHTYLNREH